MGIEMIILDVVLVVGSFIFGVLFGRKNKATVERSLVATQSALNTAREELMRSEGALTKLIKEKTTKSK